MKPSRWFSCPAIPVARFAPFAPLATLALAALAVTGAGACSNKMEQKDCLQLREDAFELLNKAQHCNNDAECRQSDWPGCAKPVSTPSYDKIKPKKEAFVKGQCDETKASCREAPEVYCKQGLCVHREKGTPEGAGNTPTDQIIIQ
jgi:hypothetical protein